MATYDVRNTNALISAAAVIVIIYGMQAAKVLLVPFLLAVFLALITVRPMLWLQQKKVPSIAAALLIVITMMLILGFLAARNRSPTWASSLIPVGRWAWRQPY